MKLQLILAVDAAAIVGSSSLLGAGLLEMSFYRALTTLQTAGLYLGPRDALEKNPNFLQIIPYVVVMVGEKVMRYTRTPQGGEPRLHGKVSIGAGGHIDALDVSWDQGSTIKLARTLDDASWREVEEELGLEQSMPHLTSWIGLLTDFTDEVGNVHIGVVRVLQLPEGTVVQTKEDALTSIQLATLEELKDERPRMEKWSQHVLDYLISTSA